MCYTFFNEYEFSPLSVYLSTPPEGSGKTYKTVNGHEAKVKTGQQNKHIPETNEYKTATANGDVKSILNGSAEDIQQRE
jgi:hypothetical protein